MVARVERVGRLVDDVVTDHEAVHLAREFHPVELPAGSEFVTRCFEERCEANPAAVVEKVTGGRAGLDRDQTALYPPPELKFI